MKSPDTKRIAHFLFELGTMRKLPRIHMQTLLAGDLSDNIASHSYVVTMVGWILAQIEGADVNKVLKMCLLHDVGEIRSGDHNWVHKKYVKIFDDEIKEEQLGEFKKFEFRDILDEYDRRETLEAKVAKDADLVGQIILLREYEWQGNKEAGMWLRGKGEKERNYRKTEDLNTKSAIKIGKALYDVRPSEWWDNTYTNKNR